MNDHTFMPMLVPVLLICCAVTVLHTCFSEAHHLNRRKDRQIILMFFLIGSLDLLRKYSSHRINQSCNQIYP